MSEDVHSHIRTYMKVAAALAVLTAVTVAVSYIDFWGVPIAVIVALIIAGTKGSLVASFFMHLIGEQKMIHWTLMVTVLFFLVLIFLPLLGHTDRVGEYYTVPNANAPAPAAPAH